MCFSFRDTGRCSHGSSCKYEHVRGSRVLLQSSTDVSDTKGSEDNDVDKHEECDAKKTRFDLDSSAEDASFLGFDSKEDFTDFYQAIYGDHADCYLDAGATSPSFSTSQVLMRRSRPTPRIQLRGGRPANWNPIVLCDSEGESITSPESSPLRGEVKTQAASEVKGPSIINLVSETDSASETVDQLPIDEGSSGEETERLPSPVPIVSKTIPFDESKSASLPILPDWPNNNILRTILQDSHLARNRQYIRLGSLPTRMEGCRVSRSTNGVDLFTVHRGGSVCRVQF